MGKIIAFTGAQGTGKTTSVYQKAAFLKANTDCRVGVLAETASYCPFPINEERTREAQLWIFAEQMRQELEMASKHDVVVADRTVYDNIAYALSGAMVEMASRLTEVAKYMNPYYETIYFKKIASNDYLKPDGVRSVDKNFQKNIENALVTVYKASGLNDKIQEV